MGSGVGTWTRLGGADMVAATTLTLALGDSGAKQEPRSPSDQGTFGAVAASPGERGRQATTSPPASGGGDLVDRGLRAGCLQPLPRRGQEPGCLQAVENPVVEREAEVHHRLDP